ncbi:HAD-IA family hydrolase [Allopontixanthobacter sediminis]|uniref:HAD-IA family hydrolase n=1 Tax=Allopontixanthobacter sediminis TaxID=1689985 RepID=UPI0019269DE6|nr:HAD-IA family hydrolase [Allopontixanthobacter sediminis]
MSVRLAVFDCDGTLVDGQASICEAMDRGFASAGLPPPDHHLVRRIVGLSLPQAVRILAPGAAASDQVQVVEGYKQAFRDSRTEGRLEEPMFDGIAELIVQLRERGWLLAVATGKSDRGLESCLAGHGVIDHFISLQTADRHPSKPHPAMLEAAMADAAAMPRDTVMIGDTSFDIDMARAINVRAIGVDWGYHTSAELTAAGAQAVATSAQNLGELLG